MITTSKTAAHARPRTWGNQGLRNRDEGRAGQAYQCTVCGHKWYDNLDLPSDIPIVCPFCGCCSYVEIR